MIRTFLSLYTDNGPNCPACNTPGIYRYDCRIRTDISDAPDLGSASARCYMCHNVTTGITIPQIPGVTHAYDLNPSDISAAFQHHLDNPHITLGRR